VVLVFLESKEWFLESMWGETKRGAVAEALCCLMFSLFFSLSFVVYPAASLVMVVLIVYFWEGKAAC
jgi:hypothetical protein